MNKPSRRAVVRTGVWAVPAVAAVAAAPAFAGSGTPPPVIIEGTGIACKFPGRSTAYNYGYRMTLTFDNTTGTAQPITIINFEISGKTTTDIDPTSFVVPADTSTKTFVVLSSNSAQRYATVTYEVLGQVYTTVVDFGSFPPCKCDGDPTDPTTTCS